MNKKELIELLENKIEVAEKQRQQYDENYSITKSKENFGTAKYFIGQEVALKEIIEELENEKKDFYEKINGKKYEELDIFTKLEYAKRAVEDCLQSQSVLVNWQGLVYWAQEVEKLKNEIRELL